MASKEQASVAHAYEDSSDDGVDTRDAKEMREMGKSQQFRRNFEFWSILGFSCCTMITWAGQTVTFIQGLYDGGPQGLVISLFVTWTVFAAIIASLAELMSMWPTSGGQYHWTFTLAPPQWACFLSYIDGWFCVLAWQAVVASVSFLSGTFIQGVIALNYPDYVAKPWQALLIAYAVILFSILFNTLFARWLHAVEWFIMFFYFVGFIVVLTTVIALTPHKVSAHDVFSVFTNLGGWSSNGVAWFVGLQGIVYAWLGGDAAIHMSEEVRNASRVLPRSLMASVFINGVLSIAILFAVLFCGGNVVKIAESGALYPIIPIFTYATGSVAGGTGLCAIILIIFVFCTLCAVAAGSREFWAFSRDDGLPASGWLKVVNKQAKLPLRAIFLTAIFAMLVNLIQLGSDVALNAVVSLTVSAYNASYILPFSLILYRRIQAIRGKGREPPWGPWTLGRYTGVLTNVYALIWAVLIIVWSMFPPAVNPTAKTMNWSSIMFGAIILFALGFWFVDGKRRYRGPVRDAAGGSIEPIIGWDEAPQVDLASGQHPSE